MSVRSSEGVECVGLRYPPIYFVREALPQDESINIFSKAKLQTSIGCAM